MDGTHPRLTQVPPTSFPEKTAVLRDWVREWSAAPCPPTSHPIITTSKSWLSDDIQRVEVVVVGRRRVEVVVWNRVKVVVSEVVGPKAYPRV